MADCFARFGGAASQTSERSDLQLSLTPTDVETGCKDRLFDGGVFSILCAKLAGNALMRAEAGVTATVWPFS
jgi:hypothetical protein